MIVFVLYSVLVFLVSSYVIQYALKVHKASKLTASLPGWFNIPFVGNAHKFLGNTDLLFRRMNEVSQMTDTHNGRFKLWLGPQLMILTTTPEDIKIINNAFIDRPYYFNFAQPWLGNGLITAPGHMWKGNIKKWAITFSGSVVDGFQAVYNTQANKLVAKLKGEVGRPSFDVLQDYLAQTTLETICQTALGISDLSESMVTTEYYMAFQRALDLVVARSLNVLHHSDLIYKLTANYREFQKCIKILHHLSNAVISKRRMEWEENKKKGIEPPSGKFKAFLDILMELSETDSNLTDEQIRAEVDTIIASGQETTALSLTFVLLALANNPNVQEKLHSEIKEVLGDYDRPLVKEDLAKMKYCEAVINETMRLYPPVLFAMRYIHKDFELDGYTLPEGTILTLPLWGIGRSRKSFGEDAMEFKPERWLDDASPKPIVSSPFGYGRRPCIGKRYALSLMRTVVVQCVKELEFISDGTKLELKADLTLRPKSGHMIKVRLRNGSPPLSPRPMRCI